MQIIMELRALIIEACNEMAENICRWVINNITVRVEEVARRNGGHTECLIHRGQISMQLYLFLYVSSSIVTEIKILLIDQIPDHYVHHLILQISVINLEHQGRRRTQIPIGPASVTKYSFIALPVNHI
jgi:hypothetical protein